jgi:hypothetical protein
MQAKRPKRGIVMSAVIVIVMSAVIVCVIKIGGCARQPYSELPEARIHAAAQAIHPGMPPGLKPPAGPGRHLITMGGPPGSSATP